MDRLIAQLLELLELFLVGLWGFVAHLAVGDGIRSPGSPPPERTPRRAGLRQPRSYLRPESGPRERAVVSLAETFQRRRQRRLRVDRRRGRGSDRRLGH